MCWFSAVGASSCSAWRLRCEYELESEEWDEGVSGESNGAVDVVSCLCAPVCSAVCVCSCSCVWNPSTAAVLAMGGVAPREDGPS